MQRLTVSENQLGGIVCHRNSGLLQIRRESWRLLRRIPHRWRRLPAEVVWAVVEPGQIADLVDVGISRDDGVVATVVIVEGL
jgi:hypothetical protein